MIARLRRMRDIALLIRDLPEVLGLQLELEAEDLKAREEFDRRLGELEQLVADLDSMTREFYGVRPIEEEAQRDA